ncbi:hypothetical protein PTTG_05356, partial [Puccinia triticina 1-1 BBBD Race 1]
MTPQEFKDIQFLTTTLVQLGRFYNTQTNSSFLTGIMKGFGWRKGYEPTEHAGTYTPSNIQTEEDYLEWKNLILQLPKIESIIASRFKKLAPGLFLQAVEKMQKAKVPGFGDLEFNNSNSTPFASNLTATWGEFSNQAHIDNDVGPISYGGWCGIEEASGEPASKAGGYDIEYGQFFLPGISTVVDFNAV